MKKNILKYNKSNNKKGKYYENYASAVASMEQVEDMSRIDQLLSFFNLGKKFSKPIIAVLRLNGVIGSVGLSKSGLTIESMRASIDKTFKLPKLAAVCLIINSPGGSPVQSELIAKRIYSLGKKKKIPIYSFVEDVAASGGYWLACIGEEIYASASSIVGSIGVISSGFGFQNAIDKLGIERRIFAQGKNKSVLDPFSPIKEEDKKIIHDLQKEIHNNFIDYVKDRRLGRLTQDDDILFNGEFWSGAKAVDFGIIDGIDDLYNFIEKRFGENIKIEYIENKQSWLKRKLSILTEIFSDNLSLSVLNRIKEQLFYNKYDL